MQPQNQAAPAVPADFEAGITTALQLLRAGRVTDWTYQASTVFHQLAARIGYGNEQLRTHVSISYQDVRRTIRDRWAHGYSAEAILLDMFANVPYHMTIEVLGPANGDNPHWYSDGSWGVNTPDLQRDQRTPRRVLARDVADAITAALNNPLATDAGTRALRHDWQGAQNEMETAFNGLRVNPA